MAHAFAAKTILRTSRVFALLPGRASNPRRGFSAVSASCNSDRHAQSSPIRHALVDIDGTIANGDIPIPGAVEALGELRRGMRGVRLVSNQSMERSATTVARLRRIGFSCLEDGEFFGTLSVCRQLVDDNALRPLLLLCEDAAADFDGVPTEDPNAVVIGTAPQHLHYDRLNEALRVLMRDGSRLIACNKGRYFRGPHGFEMMAGPFVAALEFSSGRQAEVVGKPSQSFFHAAAVDAANAAGLPFSPAQCVMIGDDARDDVQGAMDAGMQAILLRTGKYRPGDEKLCASPPLAVVDDLPSAVAFLRQRGLLPDQGSAPPTTRA